MKTKFIVILLCTLSLVVNACTPSGIPLVVRPTALSNPAATISMDTPHDGAIYSVGMAATLSARVSVPSSRSAIGTVELLANGASVGTGVAGDGFRSYNFDAAWTPRTAGEYYLQGRVTLTDGSTAISEPVRVCVMQLANAVPADWSGYLGLCQQPTRTAPDPALTGDPTLNAIASPNVICTPNAPVTFVAQAYDPQDLIAFVGVRIFRPDRPGDTGLGSYLNWITTHAGRVEEYRITIPLSVDFLEGLADNAQLYWRAYALDRDGREVLQFRGSEITFQTSCRPVYEIMPSATPVQQHLEIAPSETPTSVPLVPPTFTLIKNAFCRTGPDMSFADVTAIPKGDTVDILNVSEDGFWYFVYWKKFDNKCWVAKGTGESSGDLTGLKVLIGPTLPASKPSKPENPVVPPPPTPVKPPCNPLIKVCP